MKKYIVLVFIGFSFAFAKANISISSFSRTAAFIQEFLSHQVKKGETVYSISKKYNVSQEEIIKLNPDAKDEIYEGLVLILPATATEEKQLTEEDYEFKSYKVKRKDNLYRISKKYGVPQEVIKKYNKRLYSEVLRKGDRIQIPINYAEVHSSSSGGSEYLTHTVIAKETVYGLARKYDISIAELESLNPEIIEGLKEGAEVKVPKRSYAESAIIDESKYAFYEVKKGNTMYSLLPSFDMEEDELLALNPALEDGLKQGMILKVPKGTPGSHSPNAYYGGNTFDGLISEGAKGSLIDSLSNFSPKRVAVMLPFGVNRVDGENNANNEKLLKNDRILRISLDLYSGMLMAAEDAKALGISSIIDTYDTARNKNDGEATNVRKIDDIVNSNDFQNTQAVIGPLMGNNVNRASGLLVDLNIPIISPISSNMDGNKNIFVSRPDDRTLRDRMLSYLRENGDGKNIVIIADKKNTEIQNEIIALYPEAKVVRVRTSKKGKEFLYAADVVTPMSSKLPNWVFLETNDVPIISTVTTSLNAELSKKKITLFTTNKGNGYDSDEIQHTHLRNLAFHFPSVSKEYTYSLSKEFINKYEDKYKVNPSEYAIRGYDLMYDTLLRLSYANDLYSAAGTGIETDYIESKFKYGMHPAGGFSNSAVYLLRYTKDLGLEEVPAIQEAE